MKPYFGRLRPCNDPVMKQVVHLLVPCGGGKSFPSSHAANHFSLAVFSSLSVGKFAKWLAPAWLLWAAVESYSQIYVGVHYPLDVLVGGTIGACIGWMTGKYFNKKFPLA